MMKAVVEIRNTIDNHGGLKAFSSATRKTRDVSRPMKRMMIAELQELMTEELNVAWHLGLIGNNRRVGSIVANSKR